MRTMKARVLVVALFLSAGLWGETRFRVVSANLTSGEEQSYDEGHGQRILKGVKPDVVLIQEFNVGDNSPSAIRAWVDATFGKHFHYYRETIDADGAIPNGIISRFPILRSGQLADPTQQNRGFAWVKLDVPGPRKLWAVSVHLSASKTEKRIRGAQALVDGLKRLVPAGDYVVLGGDFNTDSRMEKAARIIMTLFDDRHVPVDQAGNDGTNGNREHPYDWVLPNASLARHGSCVEFLAGIGQKGVSFPNGAVIDTRVFKPLSAISPARESDSDAPHMQHMAVVKEFTIP